MKPLSYLPVALLLSLSGVHADDPATVEQRCATLVRQLGDDSFEVREQAARELLEMGGKARPALQQGAASDDPEVRRRCRELLPKVVEADRKARLAAFVADTEGKFEHDLPGWERFREVVGTDRTARDLFAATLRTNTAFLNEVSDHPEVAGERCAARCRDMFHHLFEKPDTTARIIDLHELNAVLLVAGDPAVDVPLEAEQTIAALLQHPSIRFALSRKGPPSFHNLVLAWMKRQTEDDETAQQMFFVVRTVDFRPGLDLALEVLRKRPVKDRGLAAALTTVGKLGNKEEHRKVLEKFLTDRTRVGDFKLGNVRGTTEVGDVALAMLVHLTGQDFADYGFVQGNTNNHLKFSCNFLGFENNGSREKAFAHWRSWAGDR
jgi:hypothetical protein